jgi:diguanylate cyclase (GGDEF)-like protein
MVARVRHLFGRLTDVGEARSALGRALLYERFRALQRQIPLLYTVALVNFLGLAFASGLANFTLLHPANLLVLFVVVRMGHWLRNRGRQLAPEEIQSELRRTLFLAALISFGFGFYAITQFNLSSAYQQGLVILFASLASVGCAYALASFPVGARMPVWLLAIPFAGRLLLSPNPGHIAVGISLVLTALLVLRLVKIHDEGFVELVRSRSAVESERERAQHAEQAALTEKARVREVADTDPLTGLANRRAFIAELEERLGRNGGRPFALALLDLDDFKPINDIFGHAAGDAVLIEVAARLRRQGGAGPLTARIGGDEFALILPCGDESAAERTGMRICEMLGRPYHVEGRDFRISSCAGLVVLTPGGGDVRTALSRADAALYTGKEKGRGSAAVFTAEIEQANGRRIEIERRLSDPSIREAISLSYQPIFDLSTGALRSFEALARWTDPDLGLISPVEFIPIAEQINVIEGISDGLLARSAREAARWPDAVRLSFNLSAVQLCTAGSAPRLLAIIAAEGLAPERLQIEVTETSMLADFATARVNLEALRVAGARILLDDFGAGFASISYLREMIFDAIKIDGSLIAGVPQSPIGVRLLKGVLDLCASLRVPCVAEHIETQEQIDMLRQFGCRDGQGFALSAPLDAEEAGALGAAKVVPFAARNRGRRKHDSAA